MERIVKVYYCSVCHICKTPLEAMKFCSGCKLIQYCSTSHQKQDWPDHKDICKSVQYIMKRANTEHVYQEANSFAAEDVVSWKNLRISVLKLVELIMKRPLTPIESQMLLFPPVCSYCYVYKVNKMFSCEFCKSVLYCSKVHQSSDKKHLSTCNLLSQCFETDLFMSTYSSDHCSEVVDKRSITELPENMEILLSSNSCLTSSTIFLSELLSYSLTLVFVISKVATICADSLTLHIVGADSIEVIALETFPLIFHLLPHLTYLNIVMIGPNVLNEIYLPPSIESKCSLFPVSNTLYHEYVSSSSCIVPDLIAVFNCGFCEYMSSPENDTWKNSLASLLSINNCVVTITSYTERESEGDLKRLCEFKRDDLQCNILLECKQNPFSSLYPHRDWDNDTDGVFYPNRYISVLKTGLEVIYI